MKVYGSQEIVEPIKILGEKVLIRTNIERISKETEQGIEEMWQYDEKRMSKDEYIQSLIEKTNEQELVMSDLTELLLDKGVIY